MLFENDKTIRNIAENQQKLVTEKPKGYVKLLEAENAKAAKLSKDANKILPNQLKGTLGNVWSIIASKAVSY